MKYALGPLLLVLLTLAPGVGCSPLLNTTGDLASFASPTPGAAPSPGPEGVTLVASPSPSPEASSSPSASPSSSPSPSPSPSASPSPSPSPTVQTAASVAGLQKGQVVNISKNTSGTALNDYSSLLSLSRNGRYVLLGTNATNAVAGVASGTHLYRKDLKTGALELVDCNASGTVANASYYYSGSISADGRYVAFDSPATNLAANTGGGYRQVYLKDMTNGAISVVSSRSNGVPIQSVSVDNTAMSQITSDGAYVYFWSRANSLVTEEFPNPALLTSNWHIYRKAIATGKLRLVTTDSAGAELIGQPYSIFPNEDGNRIYYYDLAGKIGIKDLSTGTHSYLLANASVVTGIKIPGGTETITSTWTRTIPFIADNSSISGLSGRHGYLYDTVAGTYSVFTVDPNGTPISTPSTTSAYFYDETQGDVFFRSTESGLVAGGALGFQYYRYAKTGSKNSVVSTDSSGNTVSFSNNGYIGGQPSRDGSLFVYTAISSTFTPESSGLRQVYAKALP